MGPYIFIFIGKIFFALSFTEFWKNIFEQRWKKVDLDCFWFYLSATVQLFSSVIDSVYNF
jgi:hypothetical protein